jgi:hypothetical protein
VTHRWLLIVLTACAAVPVRDHAEQTLATAAHWQGPRPSVVWFGDGCYYVRAEFWGGEYEHLVRATTDVLPAGELAWEIEPPEHVVHEPYVTPWPEPGMVFAGRGRDLAGYDAFLSELNEHRCHARWAGAFEVPPVAIEVRDHDETAFADLGLVVPRSITLSRAAQEVACLEGVRSAHMVAHVCVQHGAPRLDYETSGDIATVLHDLLEHAELRGTPRARCAYVEIATSEIACRWKVEHRAI